uniref:ARAD1C23342p n=1 Tax=Blastobotrys adeninivorans TaxID=409370 RepID=A0A060T1S8_BLAAD
MSFSRITSGNAKVFVRSLASSLGPSNAPSPSTSAPLFRSNNPNTYQFAILCPTRSNSSSIWTQDRSFFTHPASSVVNSNGPALGAIGSTSACMSTDATSAAAVVNGGGPQGHTHPKNIARQAHRGEINRMAELTASVGKPATYQSLVEDVETIDKAMKIYKGLADKGLVTAKETATLVRTIHVVFDNQKRQFQVISFERSKKTKYIASKLLEHLTVITNYLLAGSVITTAFGLMQLFTCYMIMGQPERGIEVWHELIASAQVSDETKKLAKDPKVVGAVVELNLALGRTIDEIEAVYNSSREAGFSHANLEHSLARAYILYGHVPEALQLFANMVKTYPKEYYHLVRVHETFVGDCADVDVARSFFEEAVANQTPYSIQLHPSAILRLMQRQWQRDHSYDDQLEIWSKYMASLRPGMKESRYNVVTYNLITVLVEAYPEPTPEALDKLKELISTYSKHHERISRIFLNTLLSRVAPAWKDTNVILGTISMYEQYGVLNASDSLRVILNSLAFAEVDNSVIDKFWSQRISLENERVEVYDFSALARACSFEGRHDLFAKLVKDAVDNARFSRSVKKNSLLEYFNTVPEVKFAQSVIADLFPDAPINESGYFSA